MYSLWLVDDFFRLAETRTANGVRAKLEQTFASPSFMRSHTVLVFVAGSHSRCLMSVPPISKRLQIMITETFNFLCCHPSCWAHTCPSIESPLRNRVLAVVTVAIYAGLFEEVGVAIREVLSSADGHLT